MSRHSGEPCFGCGNIPDTLYSYKCGEWYCKECLKDYIYSEADADDFLNAFPDIISADPEEILIGRAFDDYN